MTDWRIDERDFAGAEHLDADYVARYEAKAQFDPTEDVAALEALGMGPASTVIDLGAGTGVFAFAAAHTGAHIRAVDVSPAMVAATSAEVASAESVSGCAAPPIQTRTARREASTRTTARAAGRSSSCRPTRI